MWVAEVSCACGSYPYASCLRYLQSSGNSRSSSNPPFAPPRGLSDASYFILQGYDPCDGHGLRNFRCSFDNRYVHLLPLGTRATLPALRYWRNVVDRVTATYASRKVG